MSRQYTLYRHDNADGTAKEWAYADLGGGMAEIRWGKAGALRQGHQKPQREAVDLSQRKLRKGYSYIGKVWLDASGNHVAAPQPSPTPIRATPTPAQPAFTQPKPAPKPVNVTELLGGDDGDDGWF